MIYGIGSDIVAIARIRRMLERYGDQAVARILAPLERRNALGEAPARADLLAKRFAAKEAFAKALGTGLRHPVSLQNISVVHDALGKPEFAFDPILAQLLEQEGVRYCHLSLSDEKDFACAFVVLER